MGNHKLELISAMKSFQYGSQSGTLPIESARNVGDDFSVRVDGPHVRDLSIEVAPLLGGTDPAVTHDGGPGCPTQVGVNVVETLASGVAVVEDFAFVGIPPQRLGMESQHGSCLSTRYVYHVRNIGNCTALFNIILSRRKPSNPLPFRALNPNPPKG